MPVLQTVRQYTPAQPYYYEIDNIPITDLIGNINTINTQVDINTQAILNAAGTAGSLAYRLNASMDSAGHLTQAAVNYANHNIADHAEAGVSNGDGTYVVMTLAERARLALMADNSTSLALTVLAGSISSYTPYYFTNETVTLQPSATIQWAKSTDSMGNPLISANYVFTGAAHQHVYNETPAGSDYQHYTVLGGSYTSGSLRVYVNGVRLFEGTSVYVPTNTVSPITWVANYYTETSDSAGTFTLYAAIGSSDIIIVDYDQALAD